MSGGTEQTRRIIKTDNAEFRYYGNELDEIVANNVDLHFECMATGAWWMSIRTPNGDNYMVNLGVKRRNHDYDADWNDKKLTNWAFHEDD